jgi:hypothetical protein
MRVAGPALVVMWLKAAPSANGNGSKSAQAETPTGENGAEPRPDTMVSG